MRVLVFLFAENVAITLAALALWLGLGFWAGRAVAAAREPGAARYISTGGSVSTSSLERYYKIPDNAVMFAGWCGLLTAQATFVAHRFGSTRDSRPGGFPVTVKEL